MRAIRLSSTLAFPSVLTHFRSYVNTNHKEKTISKEMTLSYHIRNGNLEEAMKTIERTPQCNVISYNTVISAYTKAGKTLEAMKLLCKMQQNDIHPDEFTFSIILPACNSPRTLKKIHALIILRGLLFDSFVESRLITMYVKHDCMADARHIFDKTPNPSAFTYNTILLGYVKNNLLGEGRVLFDKMGKHGLISWNIMISAYVKNTKFSEGMQLYIHMRKEGVSPDSETLNRAISAFANLGQIDQCQCVHCDVIKRGYEGNVFIGSGLVKMYSGFGVVDYAFMVFDGMAEKDLTLWNCMVFAYVENKDLEKALQVFEEMPERDILSWSGIIKAYMRSDEYIKSLKLFAEMQLSTIRPDLDIFSSILAAAANLVDLRNGMCVHAMLIRKGHWESNDVCLGNSLINMYVKCGSIGYARFVFDRMRSHDVVNWTALILGYAMHGFGEEALAIFEDMLYRCIKPDEVTFVGVLAACCHAGLVEKGWYYFRFMSEVYGIKPGIEHYSCMVDLLGRAGEIKQAFDFIQKMPFEPNVNVWCCLLGACRVHKNLEIGQCAAERLIEVDPDNSSNYVYLASIYAALGRWGDAERIRSVMKTRGVKKIPGCSWIQVNNNVHTFVIHDHAHPQRAQIYDALGRLLGKMKEQGYVPDTEFAVRDVEEEQKEEVLCYHSERLAIAFGIISSPLSSSLQIVKNLRVCVDCHTATKFISRIVRREIVVRDPSRFHHFIDGKCSCGDFW